MHQHALSGNRDLLDAVLLSQLRLARAPSAARLDRSGPPARAQPLAPAPFDFGGLSLLPPSEGGPPIQAFSAPGTSDDAYEKEAHAVADSLEGKQDLGGAGSTPKIRPVGSGLAGLRGLHPSIQSSISDARGIGSSLPQELSLSLGSRLGADLGGVRIHTDERADSLSRQLNARAFTSGRDIFFRKGHYDPSSAEGRSVLTHELTHVVQQCGGSGGGAGNVTGEGLSPPSQPSVQRFIMQIGSDDNYTSSMFNKLHLQHRNERFLKIYSRWNFFGSDYNPKKFKYHQGQGVTYETSRKLKNVPADEPLRLVAHGNLRGQVGGYSGSELAHMLARIGLRQDHSGGIEVNACLPASAWSQTDPQTNTRVDRQPHIVELQAQLRQLGYANDTVLGYEHCIFPNGRNNTEVASRGYALYTQVLMAIDQQRFRHRNYQLSPQQLNLINSTLGAREAQTLLYMAPNGLLPYTNFSRFMTDLQMAMTRQGLLFLDARLRRANSVQLNNIPLLPP
ncbi:MAG: DUF4157 domain-containing protein [Polyangia bacterium]